ncbi:MAG: aspartate--tRNA ligase [Rickettsiales bacterium]|nr:aspartate--tRNA ligase [Rickettsiales bacterium]|tara:strand:- start:15589 stop:17397 length:1809 start_codon:yes stop_codon:yes gene_type:complete
MSLHPYRSHTCGQLSTADVGAHVRLSGWVHRKRDHGHLLFVDLRDHYGITQCVIDSTNPLFEQAEACKLESVVTVSGEVVQRTPQTVNADLKTGEVEVKITGIHTESPCVDLPLQVNSDGPYSEEIRLKNRFFDLRREKIHNNIVMRSQVLQRTRQLMVEQGFLEIQTPILTASSPEGARDFLVPSRLHPGKFYALPQAPQQFKQLLMISGFDKYFQIAPCFRDEDARADRSPGEFYQLDMEMSFVTQDDVFAALEPVLHAIFTEFGNKRVSPYPFIRIPYKEAMLKYGSDKPDLRNPLLITDVTEVFRGSSFAVFANLVEKGSVVRAIPGPGTGSRPRKFFDDLNSWARDHGKPGLGYIVFGEAESKGPIAKHLDDERLKQLQVEMNLGPGDSAFFVCDKADEVAEFAGAVRTKLGQELDLIKNDAFEFCWIVDFPMYELNKQTGKIDFSHNPFSMPQGGEMALHNLSPLDVLAQQYDIVCNGIELSSGAIRNHSVSTLYKAFEIAGYSPEDVDKNFSGMVNALKAGAPPHGGCAPGFDRMIMLLADEPNLREVVAFPMNQKAEDLLMGAPNNVTDEQLKELGLKKLPPKPQAAPTKIVQN